MTPARDLSPGELTALLHFYADSGVEYLLEEEAVDRIAQFAEQKSERTAKMRERPADQSAAEQRPGTSEKPGRAAPATAPRPASPAASVAVPDADAVAAAKAAAESARTLNELKAALDGFSGCNLKNGARSTVFASGSATSGIMVVGPMPSAEDDRDGMPFAGRQGQMLDRMLGAIGLSRETVMITNVIPWRPPGNRQPSPAEIEICRPFIERQIALAEPTHLLLLGNFPARFFLDSDGSIFNLRGSWREISVAGLRVQAMASLHPQDLVTAPANKALAWQDLLLFKQALPPR